jgi:hypothetical protein
MSTRLAFLPLAGLLLTQTVAIAQAPRDLSTPARRLVGHWVTPGNTHYYFGPADSLTDIGSLAWVELGADGRVVKHQYKIISQVPGGEELTLQILFGAGGSRVDPYTVAKDGISMSNRVTVVGATVTNIFTYVNDRIRPD